MILDYAQGFFKDFKYVKQVVPLVQLKAERMYDS